METIEQKAAAALKACFVSRGANKGKLLASPPRSNTLAYAAWQGAMLVCNPYKVSIFGQIMFTAEQRQVCDIVTKAFELTPRSQHLDRDRAALGSLGAW